MITEKIMNAINTLNEMLSTKSGFHSVGVKITPTETILIVYFKKSNKSALKLIPPTIDDFVVKSEII